MNSKNYNEGTAVATNYDGVSPEKLQPTIEYLLMSLEEQCGEIEYLKNRIEGCADRLQNDRIQVSVEANPIHKEVERNEHLPRLEKVVTRLRNIRISLSEINSKFESLI